MKSILKNQIREITGSNYYNGKHLGQYRTNDLATILDNLKKNA